MVRPPAAVANPAKRQVVVRYVHQGVVDRHPAADSSPEYTVPDIFIAAEPV
ncbi:hypothetical protein D3C71_1886640 [compost metagenome]